MTSSLASTSNREGEVLTVLDSLPEVADVVPPPRFLDVVPGIVGKFVTRPRPPA